MKELFKVLLEDDHGVSEQAFKVMRKHAKRSAELTDMLYRCEAVNGRYFLPESESKDES